MADNPYQQLDQNRKQLIQSINLRFRNPNLTQEQREQFLQQLKKAMEILPPV